MIQKQVYDRHDDHTCGDHTCGVSRREFMQSIAATGGALAVGGEALAALQGRPSTIGEDQRFPYFQSTPVSYLNVTMQDGFWAPRQKTVREVSVPWATRHLDQAGGLDAFQSDPVHYATEIRPGWEASEFIESLATVAGLQRDQIIDGFTRAWAQKMIATQRADGYWPFGWPLTSDPEKRWQGVWWSHEDYALGFYVDAAIAFRQATGDETLYRSALRAADNMAAMLLGGDRHYAPGHPRIEEALMHLYGETGNTRYMQLAGWLIGQRGRPEGRRSFGRYSQDHLPVEQQRSIEGHAVRAAYLFNGVTEYVGATGHAGYREAVLAVWENFVNHKMFVHGAGGLKSTRNEGYSTKPDFIPPDDCYGESCSVWGNFQWAHNLFRLTGEASHVDIAERMLYNALYASLSLNGDRYFYENAAQREEPVLRFDWHRVPCCPPNIVKLFSKVGGFFYSTDAQGIYVKHYAACHAEIPFAGGVKLTQRTRFPWDGDISFQVEPKQPMRFALRLRRPDWAKTYTVSVNGRALAPVIHQGWLIIERKWERGDTVELSLPMSVQRITMPPRFKEYANLVALQRGPLVYCIEEADIPVGSLYWYLPSNAPITAEHQSGLLGGVTVLRTALKSESDAGLPTNAVPATFIPYGVWNNRVPGAMRIWVRSGPRSPGVVFPIDPFGSELESC